MYQFKDECRQGDVLLIPLVKQCFKSEQLVSRSSEDVVLATGEAPGHTHKIAAKFLAALYVLNEAQQQQIRQILPVITHQQADALRILKVQQDAELEHQEHNSIILPPRDYLVVQQHTYTPEKVLPVRD